MVKGRRQHSCADRTRLVCPPGDGPVLTRLVTQRTQTPATASLPSLSEEHPNQHPKFSSCSVLRASGAIWNLSVHSLPQKMSTVCPRGASIALAVRDREPRASQWGGQTHRQITCLKMKNHIRAMDAEKGERVWDEPGGKSRSLFTDKRWPAKWAQHSSSITFTQHHFDLITSAFPGSDPMKGHRKMLTSEMASQDAAGWVPGCFGFPVPAPPCSLFLLPQGQA